MTPSLSAVGNVACITLEGADARRFAQAQFSGNVEALEPRHWQWNAWLTAQGRVQALMHLVDVGDGALLAVLRGGDAEAILATLERYRLRMQTTLGLRSFTGCVGGPAPTGIAGMDGEGAVFLGYGGRSLRLSPIPAAVDPAARVAWRLEDIRQGWPSLPPGEPEFLPPALGLEHLGAVDFGKGCYPGQEIVARLHYRGGHKYRLCHLRGPAVLPLGPVRGATGALTAWVLDAIALQDASEALVIASSCISLSINILEVTYSVISKFDM